MGSRQLNDHNFSDLLRNAVDITDRFDVDLGGLPDDMVRATYAVIPYISVLREQMLTHALEPDIDLDEVSFGLIDLPEWAEWHGEPVRQALQNGDVMAVDGTPLIHPQRYLTTQVFAIAVGGITSRDPLNLEAKLVKVQAEFAGDEISLEDIVQLADNADVLSDTPSWPNAFRDYQERLYAINSPSRFVIVDGPLIPQGLLTREAGIQLFEKMFSGRDRKCCVGVIKDIRHGDSALRFHARALQPGEMYIYDTLDRLFAPRIGSQYRGKVRDFINTIGQHIFRGIFRPGQKAFGFECYRADLPLVASLLWLDRNNQPGYELPFLLAQVDAQIRGRYRPAETMAMIEATLAQHDVDEFFDELDERSLR